MGEVMCGRKSTHTIHVSYLLAASPRCSNELCPGLIKDTPVLSIFSERNKLISYKKKIYFVIKTTLDRDTRNCHKKMNAA